MKTLLTKKAINGLVKSKDTRTIINLYELEAKKHPFNSYKMDEYFSDLNDRQKDVAKEMLKKGATFGLPEELLWKLKELFLLVSIIHNDDGTRYIID